MDNGPRVEPNTTVLLKEHSNKMTPNDILLYPQISVSGIISEVLLFRSWKLVQNTTSEQYAESEDFETLSYNWELPPNPSPQGSRKELCVRKRKQKDCEIQRGWVTPRKQCPPDSQD